MNNIENNDINELRQTVQNQLNEIQILKQNIKYRDIAINFYKGLIQSKMNIKLPNHTIFEDDIVVYTTPKYTKYIKTVQKQPKNQSSTKPPPTKLPPTKPPSTKPPPTKPPPTKPPPTKPSPTKPSPTKPPPTKQQPTPIQSKLISTKTTPTTLKNAKILIKKKIPKDIKFSSEKNKDEIVKMINDINANIKTDSNSPTDKLWSMGFKEHCDTISKLLVTLESARNYGKYLSEIKYRRLYFLKFLDEETYKKRVVEYIDIIQDIFKKRGSDDKKIKSLMKHKIINAYEHRMLMLDDFEKTNIDIDEVNLVRKCCEHKIKDKTKFEIYSNETLIQNICNYQLCISNVLTILSNAVTNMYGFHNIVYLQFDNNNFAFYYLERFSKNKRKWIMDCRLDDIANEIRDKALNYCIYMFRKIYQKIFYDNQYRSDFIDVSQVMELEGIQLLKNIVYLNDYLQFVKDFQNIIKSCNQYNPTELDDFNLFTDDPLLKIEDKTVKIDEQFKNIFDNMTKKQSSDLYYFIQKQK